VRIAGAGRLGVPALLLAAVAACGPADDARPAAATDAAVPSYEPPDGAPGFCTRLAAVDELGRLPESLGMLLTGADVEARTQVSQAVGELREVLAEVRENGGHEQLATALDDLVRALGSAVDGPLTAAVGASVSAGLAQVGEQAQPPCGFPT
jgi:hypothetical protein